MGGRPRTPRPADNSNPGMDGVHSSSAPFACDSQVGCRPKVLADSIKHVKFRETLCLVKVKPGNSGAPSAGRSLQQHTSATAAATSLASELNNEGRLDAGGSSIRRALLDDHPAPPAHGPVPLEGMSIASRDWPLGQLKHLQHTSGMNMYEKSWVSRLSTLRSSVSLGGAHCCRTPTAASPVIVLTLPCSCTLLSQVGFQYQGSVLWSRHLHPHQVVTVHANGVASTLYRTNSTPVFRPLHSICGKGARLF